MGDFSTHRVRETLLSRKPREWSLEITALFLSMIMGISLLAWRNGAALLPTLAATSEGVLKQGEYWRLLTAIQAAEKSASLGSWLSEPLFFRVQRPFFLLFRSSFRGCCAPPKTPRPSPTPPESVSRDAADWPPWPTSGTTSSPSSLRAPSPAVECCSISPNQTLSRLACASSG